MIEPQASNRRIALASLAAAVAVCVAVPAEAKKKPLPPPVLDAEHVAPSGAFRFLTPAGWKVSTRGTHPEIVEAAGDGMRVRFLHQDGEHGLDSLHGTCMLERLAPPVEQSPQIAYEYDFIDGALGERRALDSAFTVKYDDPIDGHKEWRQRNVTVVGGGTSMCAISYAPGAIWKKDREKRALLEAVLGSVSLK